jgi:putative toxin-antitoxin system antitoxin component (TIGR02293 family)
MEANHVIENLLGRLPGGAARGAYQLHALVGEGLPAGVISRIERALDLSAAESARVFGLSATSRKRYKGTPRKRLDPAASDRIVRVVSAVAEAVEIFGDESKAIAWFKTPSLALGDERPIDLMTSDPGAKLVRDELLRIRYGHWA